MTHARTLGLLAGLSLLSTGLQAATAPPLVINITANRTPQSNVDTLASVTVIDRAQIERLQARSVPDALRGVPGLGISSNGGRGKLTTMFMRGTESDHVLVLVDGIRVGSATAGLTSFQDIPIDQVERIEVVRGPRSSLYGADAIGGVVQIFTKKGGGALTPRLSVGGGSHGMQDYSAGLSGGGDRGWFNVGGSHIATRGFNACDGAPFPAGGGCFTTEPDRDPYRNTGASLRAGYKFTDAFEIEGHYLRSDSDSEYDGSAFASNSTQLVQDVAGARLDWQALPFWHMSLSGGRSRDLSDNFFEDVFSSAFDTERRSASWQNDFALAPQHRLTLGADWLDDRIQSTTAYAVSSRDNAAGFGQYQGRFGEHDLTLAARRDDNQQFGSHTTGSLAWGYRFSPTLRVMASWGSAFKAPSFNELYFPFNFGNPNLKPEESDSYEVGIAGEHAAVTWSLNAYQTKIDQLIGLDFSNAPPTPYTVNIDQARIRGLEALASTTLAGWDVAVNVSTLDPENRSHGANRGKQLPRRAKLMARLDLDRAIGVWRVGTSLYGEGQRYDDLANTYTLGSYVTLDLRAAYTLRRDWTLEGKLTNLLDKDYRTARLYNEDGRNVMFTVRYAPMGQ